MQTAASSGLLPAPHLELRFDALVVAAANAYLESLGEIEKTRAAGILRSAKVAAEYAWSRTLSGVAGPEPAPPRAPGEASEGVGGDAD